MIKIKKLVRPHEKLPKFYGVSWLDYQRDVVISYPVPLNIIISKIRILYHKIKFDFNYQSCIDTLENAAYSKGVSYGKSLSDAEKIIMRRTIERLENKLKGKNK